MLSLAGRGCEFLASFLRGEVAPFGECASNARIWVDLILAFDFCFRDARLQQLMRSISSVNN
jgi:hypothetical protein